MRINRVILSNYTQHENLDVEISNDFVGIVGENGSGKSNFVNAISDCVTGEFHKKKSLIVTHGKKSGFIRLFGDIDGEEFELQRSFPSSDATLKIGDSVFNGAELVNAQIFNRLECDKSFISNMVFVKQEDVLGILFGRPSDRNKLLQKFFGLDRALKIESTISSWISNLPEIVEIDESAIITERDHAIAERDSLKKEVDSLIKEVESRKSESAKDLEFLERAEELYKKAKKYESLEQEILMLEEEKKALMKSISSIKAPTISLEDVEAIGEKVAKSKELYASLKQLLSFIRGNKDIENGLETCPVCDSRLDSFSLAQIKEKSSKIEKQLEDVSVRLKLDIETHNYYEKEIRDYNEKISSIKKRLSIVESRLDQSRIEIDGNKTKNPSKVYKEAIDNVLKDQTEISIMEEKISHLNRSIKVQDGIITRCESSILSSQKAKKENKATRAHKERAQRLQKIFRYNGSATERYVNLRVQKMCHSINQYLLGFSSPYQIEVNENNDFIANFKDKSVLSSELSGGQKVILSLAFRFAASELFTSKTNLIVLDEPTTWLDKKRIECFGDILSDVKEMSARKNMQVFIVTHEKSLIPHFDQVISFN